MFRIVLGLVLSSAPAAAVAAMPGTASVRAGSARPHPRPRSHDEQRAVPHVQMGAGPTALAMMSLVMAVVVRRVRQKRAASQATP